MAGAFGLEEMEVHVRGVVPILHHNVRLADPLDTFVQAIAKLACKTKKTEADRLEMAHLEFLGGLYLDGDKEPCLPGHLIEATLRNAARKSNKGKSVEAGVACEEDPKLIYRGPKEAAKLWELPEFRHYVPVQVRGARIMRMRPKFPAGWECKFRLVYSPGEVNRSDLLGWLRVAGRIIGFADGRPRFGRFEVLSPNGD